MTSKHLVKLRLMPSHNSRTSLKSFAGGAFRETAWVLVSANAAMSAFVNIFCLFSFLILIDFGEETLLRSKYVH